MQRKTIHRKTIAALESYGQTAAGLTTTTAGTTEAFRDLGASLSTPPAGRMPDWKRALLKDAQKAENRRHRHVVRRGLRGIVKGGR